MLKGILTRRSIPAWVMLGVGLLVTVFASLQVKQVIEDDARKMFSFHCDQVTLKISERLGAYALILRSGAAFIAGSETVKRLEWQDYVETLRAQDSIPGVQGIGFSKVIRANQLDAHIADIRAEGFSEYSVWPSGERATYTSVIYLEPFRGRNLRAFGYDMLSEQVRRAAMEQARDTGKVTMSGKVELMQETGNETQTGTLMYAPVYRNNMPRDNADQRRAALIGWVYSPYRMNDLMREILHDWVGRDGKGLELNIYDGSQATPASLLFDNDATHTPDPDSLLYQKRTIELNGRQWSLVFGAKLPASGIEYAGLWIALIGGVLLSGLLFGLILSALNTRAKAVRIASALTAEIRNNETALKESEYRWKFAVEGSRDGLWDWDVTTGTVFYSNRWKEMLGFFDNEIGNGIDEWEKRLHPDDKPQAMAALQELVDGTTSVYISEHRLLCKDGSWRWSLDRGMAVEHTSDGRALRVIGTQSNISHRKEAEARIQRLTQLYAALSHCNQAIVRCASEEALFSEICRVVVLHGGMKMAWIGMVDAASAQMQTAGSFGMSSEYLRGIQDLLKAGAPSGNMPAAITIREGRAVWCQDFLSDPAMAQWHERAAHFDWRAVATLPLYRMGAAVGVFALYASETGAFDPASRELLEEIAHDVSAAMDNFVRISEQQRATMALLESEARYSALFSGNSVAMLLIDPSDGCIVNANDAASAFYGWDIATLRSMNIRDINTLDYVLLQPQLKLALKSEQKHFFFQHRRANGDLRDVETFTGPIIVGGKALVLSSIHDITERRKTELALRHSEGRYSVLFEQNIVPMLLIDTSDGRIVDANRQACAFYGWEADTLRSMSIHDLNTLGSEQLLPELGRALHFNKRQLFFQHRRANGELRDVEFFSGPVVLGGKTLLLSSITDITERKKTELALHESESFNATVLNSLVEHIAVLDSQGVIVSVNSAWLQFAKENGASVIAEYWIGQNYLDICSTSFNSSKNSDGALAQEGIHAVLSGEIADFDMEYACHSPREPRWFIMHITPLKRSQSGVVVTHENITHRKLSEIEIQASHSRLEELTLQLIDAQEQERKNIARELHDELGQRFATLKMNLHHMRQYLGNTGGESTWQSANEDITALIAQMRSISSALRPPMLDYLGLEVSIKQLLEQHFFNTPITYVLEYAGLPSKIPEPIEITVYRIIQESITNIVRHADASHVIVEVNGGENANEIEIIIRDNGIGFDPAHVDMSQQRSFGLIGMGERVKLLSGELHVSSAIGSGTRITALLPLKND